MLDYIIKNGIIVDGSGIEPIKGNIGISGDKITYVGSKEMPALTAIDADGLIVAPGFIDTHGHSEFIMLADNRAEGKLSQGVTSEINGNCGVSAAPLLGDAFAHRETDLKELGIRERWTSLRAYLDILRNQGISFNFATLCGHGNIRASVFGYKDRHPDKLEMNEMKALLSDALRDGAKGLSTGLIYPPGIYSDTGELIELSKILDAGCVYASHMRSEGDALIEAISEIINIGEQAAVNVHISHLKTSGKQNWWKIDDAIVMIDSARTKGLKLTCDRYPYIAASTDLDSILPSWVYEGGVASEMRRLNDKTARGRIISEISGRTDDYWRSVCVSSVKKSINKWMEGENILDISHKIDKSPEDTVIDIIADEDARAGAIFFSMSEDNLLRFLSLPYAMIGSDSSARSFSGITCVGKPHPRGFGSFARFIGKYVREGKLMSLSSAVKKITSLPASTFGLYGRGIIKQGYYADIVIFDYEKITDRATFKEPYRKSDGINYVFVNGALAIKEGEFTGALSGRIL